MADLPEFLYCPPCDLQQQVEDQWEDEDQYQRPVRVLRFRECGHEQVEDIKPRRTHEEPHAFG